MKRAAYLIPVLVFMLSPRLEAQSPVAADTTRPVTPAPVDTSSGLRWLHAGRDTAAVDTLHRNIPSKKSPGLALLLSSIVPGAGQLYNGSYWKVPVVFGFAVYFGSVWIDNNKKYHDYRDQYTASLVTFPGQGDPGLLSIRDFYRSQRDTFAWYMLILYIVNDVDAYVDASLHDFNVSGDLSLRLLPSTTPTGDQGMQLQLHWNF